MDAVDNVWIALWFATHEQISDGRHAYHQRMSADDHSGRKVYIAVINTGEVQTTRLPGYLVGRETRMIDLRYAVPSLYVRPHAQHGLLVAVAKLPPGSVGSLKDQVVAYIEIDLRHALTWLGNGAMLGSYVVFPPAARDPGYRSLIDLNVAPPENLEDITIYGPGR